MWISQGGVPIQRSLTCVNLELPSELWDQLGLHRAREQPVFVSSSALRSLYISQQNTEQYSMLYTLQSTAVCIYRTRIQNDTACCIVQAI
jgi:hypothetical protein